MQTQSLSLAGLLTEVYDALARDLQKLDEAAAVFPGDALSGLKTRLVTVWRHLVEHFRFEEQNDYMDAVRQRELRLERTLRQLRRRASWPSTPTRKIAEESPCPAAPAML